MADSIENAEFKNHGDYYILRLNPIIQILSIQSYDDEANGVTPTSTFIKEFRYSLNAGVSFTPWTTLTDVALQAISLTVTDVIYFEVKYTRNDSVYNPSVMRLKEFSLDNVQVEEHVVVKINKTNYDSLYGTDKYFAIVNGITVFNQWSVPKFGVFVYIQHSASLTGQNISIENIQNGTNRDIDLNVLLKTEFGKRLIKVFNDIDINPNNPRS